jgi:hypothetical protein
MIDRSEEAEHQKRHIILLESFRTNYRHSGHQNSEVINSGGYVTTNEIYLIAK